VRQKDPGPPIFLYNVSRTEYKSLSTIHNPLSPPFDLRVINYRAANRKSDQPPTHRPQALARVGAMGLSKSTRITILLAIDTVFFLIELITGYAVHSLALVADSFHMVSVAMDTTGNI